MQLCDSDVSANFNIYIGSFAATLLIILFWQMKEFFEGSGVYWYSSQRAICSAQQNERSTLIRLLMYSSQKKCSRCHVQEGRRRGKN